MGLKKMNPWVRALLGGAVSGIVMLLLTAGAAKLVEEGLLQITWADFLGYGILALSAIIGCLTTAFQKTRLCLPRTAVSGGVFFLTLCVLNGLLLRGEFHRLLPTAGIVLASVLLSSLLGAGKGMKTYS